MKLEKGGHYGSSTGGHYGSTDGHELLISDPLSKRVNEFDRPVLLREGEGEVFLFIFRSRR